MYFLYAIKAVVYTTEANEPNLIVKDAIKFYFIIDYSPLQYKCLLQKWMFHSVLWYFRNILDHISNDIHYIHR